jgi:hypothetical protein
VPGGARLCFECLAVFLASQDSTAQESLPETCAALERQTLGIAMANRAMVAIFFLWLARVGTRSSSSQTQ